MDCLKQCFKFTKLYSSEDHNLARQQFKKCTVVTAEKIVHKGNNVNISSRAIVYAPVGNVAVFKDSLDTVKRVPKIAIIGFSTSLAAMNNYNQIYLLTNDFNGSCIICSFGGSPVLRRNIIRIVKFLCLKNILGDELSPEDMFNVFQQQILYTQIIKCCSVGNINGVFSDTSAIYPSLVNKRIRKQYLDESGHTECIKTTFIKDINFKTPIPLILIFKPAWSNLSRLGLIESINGNVKSWIPHPSNPGNAVNNMLKAFESSLDFNKYNTTESTNQLIDLRNIIKQAFG